MKTKMVFSLVGLLLVGLSDPAWARGGGGGFGGGGFGGGAHFGGGGGGGHFGGGGGFHGAPAFRGGGYGGLRYSFAYDRPTDDRFSCARKVISPDRQSIPRCLHTNAVLRLPLAIARRGRQQHPVESHLSQRGGPARMRGITSLHEKLGTGIPIGTAEVHISGRTLVGLGRRLLARFG